MTRPATLLLTLLLAAIQPLFGQKPHQDSLPTQITGQIIDTSEVQKLQYAIVALLRSKDSVLVRFDRTGKDGHFRLSAPKPGQYILLVSYPRYADHTDQLTITDSSGPQNLPPIPMVLKSTLLQQVVVSGAKGGIRIKGDTTEFKADSFHTQAGATVEDLLKKLPGISVDRSGKITAQGQTVQKVLVDGEEFFGDDPTLVTQNLHADMIDKVQLYDKKSDQATFTGVDDGQRTKTINLKMKDSKKNGYFGKLSAGAGTDGYYDTQGMLNMFRGKRKFAAYGIGSNTGKTGLNWQERDKYGQDDQGMQFDEISGFFSSETPNDELTSWSGKYEGQGLPSVVTGGIHYNDKWNDDRQSANGNYKVMQLKVKDSSNTNSENILPDTLYYNRQSQRTDNRILRHSASGTYEYKFDSTSSLRLLADGGSDHKTTFSAIHSQALAQDSSLVNSNERTVSTTGDLRQVNSDLLWRKKLPKAGRTISVDLRENFTNNSSSGYLNSDTRLYSGSSYRDSLINQYKVNHAQHILLDGRATYTEPLSRSSALTFNYGLAIVNDHSDRSSYNQSGGGKYDALDSLYSNDYQFNVLTHRTGLAYTFTGKKLRFSAGGNIGLTSFDQKDLHADTSAHRNFLNWFPQANFSYSFSSMQKLVFMYKGNTTQPTLQQIQPLATNEDPLNIVIGNPGLKPQFSNQFSVFYNDYKVMSERGIWSYMTGTFTQDAISNSSTIDANGRRVTQSVNVNGNYQVYLYFSYNFKWKKPNLQVNLETNANQSNNISIVNGLRNNTESGNYRFGANLNKSKEEKFDLGIGASATYTQSHSSINTGIATDYWIAELRGDATVFLPLKTELHADCQINLRQKTSVFSSNNNVVLLNAFLSKKFFKSKELETRISGNDLLNQNIGFNRTVNSNFISQNTYLSIQRYFMFSVIWNFNKMAGASTH